jgi:hypothetical protein
MKKAEVSCRTHIGQTKDGEMTELKLSYKTGTTAHKKRR